MTDRELMRQALNVLENRAPDHAVTKALRERLAQPAQSPLDRMAENARELGLDYEPEQEPDGPICDGWQLSVSDGHSGYGVYAHMEDYPEEGAVLVLPIEQPEQEPVAWQWLDTGTFRKSLPASAEPGAWRALYTTPPVNTIANSEAIPEQISEPVAMRYDFDGYGYRYIDSGSGSNWQTRIKDAEPLYDTPPRREWPTKLWLWRNHVDGRPEYWAFDNPYPLNLDNDDPQTIGEPCGYAFFKKSRDGSRGRTEEYVLSQIGLATFAPRREWVGLKIEEITGAWDNSLKWASSEVRLRDFARNIEAKLKEKNSAQ